MELIPTNGRYITLCEHDLGFIAMSSVLQKMIIIDETEDYFIEKTTNITYAQAIDNIVKYPGATQGHLVGALSALTQSKESGLISMDEYYYYLKVLALVHDLS